MSNNPLRDTPEHDARIRQRAYHLWQADGSPHGRDVEYWERARELIGIEESPGAGLLESPMLRDTAVQGETIEEADIQENLGEFPSRFTDQGDRQQTPLPRAKARKHEKEE
jgi:hypothetical protein